MTVVENVCHWRAVCDLVVVVVVVVRCLLRLLRMTNARKMRKTLVTVDNTHEMAIVAMSTPPPAETEACTRQRFTYSKNAIAISLNSTGHRHRHGLHCRLPREDPRAKSARKSVSVSVPWNSSYTAQDEYSSYLAFSPLIDKPLCVAWTVRRETYGYLPSRRTSLVYEC